MLGVQVRVVDRGGAVADGAAPALCRLLEQRTHLDAVLELPVHRDAAVEQVAVGGVADAKALCCRRHLPLALELRAAGRLAEEVDRRLRLCGPRAAAV